jgi:hypothetical protein
VFQSLKWLNSDKKPNTTQAITKLACYGFCTCFVTPNTFAIYRITGYFCGFGQKRSHLFSAVFFIGLKILPSKKKIACVTGSNKLFAKQSTTPVNDAVNNRKNKWLCELLC